MPKVCKWPDGTVCELDDLGEFLTFMSDDYVMVEVTTLQDEYVAGEDAVHNPDNLESPAHKAAREEYKNDLKGLTDDQLIAENNHSSELINREESWLEAVVAEQLHRAREKEQQSGKYDHQLDALGSSGSTVKDHE